MMSVWPAEDLENVGNCPVCGGVGKVYKTDLTDIIFKCAPGSWTVKACDSCQSSYLDPRPTAGSIHRAYDVYYTHGKEEDNLRKKVMQKAGGLSKAINGRLNIIYGLNRQPASPLLGRLLMLVPFLGHVFDPLGRSVHKPPHPGATLLDYGCGDGRFLLFAREMGWKVVGVDFDPKAVAAAQSLGVDVRHGGFEALKPGEQFDAITMSHVIEHVHDPLLSIRKIFDILKPNGIFNVETPNFQAYGRTRFGALWRGLDVPRHLVLFSEPALAKALSQAGFSNVTCISRNFVSLGMHAHARSLKTGKPQRKLQDMMSPIAWYDGIKAIFRSDKREFLKFTAQKIVK